MSQFTSLHSLIESDAKKSSSAVFVYDSTPSNPFGASLETAKGDAEVFTMQTRPGAGSALVGFVESVAFSSKGAQTAHQIQEDDEPPVTLLASTSSLLALVPALLSLPAKGVRPPVIAHVSAQASAINEDDQGSVSLEQVPDLQSLFEATEALDSAPESWQGAVVLSESTKEAAQVATSVAKQVLAAGYDFVNVFDGLTAGRQLTNLPTPSAATASPSSDAADLSTILAPLVPAFEYFGSSTAQNVLVIPASTYSASAKAALAALAAKEVGLVVVRVVKPWSAEQFLAALPSSTKTLHVYTPQLPETELSNNGHFYNSVLSALLTPPGFKLKVRALPVPTASVPSVPSWAETIGAFSPSLQGKDLNPLLPESAKLAVFWNLDSTSGASELVPVRLAEAFAAPAAGVTPTLQVNYDNFRQGGLQKASLLLETNGKEQKDFTLASLSATSAPSLLFLSAPAAVLKSYAAISPSTISADTRIVIAANWTTEEIVEKLPLEARKALVSVAKGKKNVFLIDVDKLAGEHAGVQAGQVSELVFWSLYLPATISPKEIVSLLAGNPSFKDWDHAKLVEINSVVRNALVQVEVVATWADEPMAVDGDVSTVTTPVVLPSNLVPTAAGPNPDRTFPDPVGGIVGLPKKSWHDVAHRLMYPEAFSLNETYEEKLRPDLPEKTYLIEVTENRRLTPNTYDRNVFHLEFNTAGTGLKYAVGEALGVHGWNDEEEVREFLDWYGLDPEAVVTVPSHADSTRVEQRTVFQLFQQNLDLFGKPGKSFYETLSKYATDKRQERALRFIACPDGHATFKKMSEVEMVTYADLLRQFPSAKPKLEDLIREIEEIKPRHYSISSAQNFVGDQVHLLIVSVEWNSPAGKPRFGQCTRYLAGLKAGQKVMVSVKPSVMKLPVNDTAPIIMAGLGTGAAPFRAFIQERAWQKAQGREIGPALYYFGSRHRSKEYLYGEEIEAYLTEGILTHTGLAFSRDTNKKVYIQDKMNEDSDLLAQSLEQGTFYLCGPTWPVGDIYETLVKAFTARGRTLEAAQAHIEELKEEERYVLEVYVSFFFPQFAKFQITDLIPL
ncbi:hypothetical protein T439DRAFT_292001 [Meredithblackwellia eburnea MCA 4105]